MSTWGETTKPRLSTQTSISLYCCNVVMGHIDGSASSPGENSSRREQLTVCTTSQQHPART